MTTTSTIEPVAQRLAQEKSPFELDDWDQALVPRFSGVVYLDAAGSARGHRIAVPDDIIRKIHGVSGRPMIIRVLSQQMRMGSYPGHANSGGSHTSGFSLLHYEPLTLGDYGASSTATLVEWPFEPLVMSSPTDDPEAGLNPSVQEFAAGMDGVQPSDAVVEMATRIVQVALDHTVGPEITVDDEDGIDFNLRLADGSLVMANLFPDGTIDASVYDDSQGVPVKTVKRMRRGTATEQDLIHLFRMGVHASTA